MTEFEWDPAPPTIKQRFVAGAYLVILIAMIGGNARQLLGSYGRHAIVLWAVVGLVLFLRFMPGLRRTP